MCQPGLSTTQLASNVINCMQKSLTGQMLVATRANYRLFGELSAAFLVLVELLLLLVDPLTADTTCDSTTSARSF
jgi:hypothetical protein